jgi:bile acid:Na+ symporter, BASS family
MLDYFARGNQWLNRNMFLSTSTAIALGLIVHLDNSPSLSILATALFAYMTFISALRTTFQDFVRILMKPSIPFWIIFLIHGVAPFAAWGAGLLFYPDDFSMRVGLLIGATIPIAVTSILWTSIVNGDIALALVTVTLDTLLIPLLIPLFFKVVLGTSIVLNYGEMMSRLLLMVTVPSILGMVVNELTKGRLEKFSVTVGGFTSKIATFFVMVINSAIVLPQISWNASVGKMMLIVFVLVSLNYLIGFLGSFFLKDRSKEVVIAMIYNVGMRNTNFGAVLAISFFPPAVAFPIILTLLYQHPIAAIVANVYIKFNRGSHLDLVSSSKN